jgi:hypothetical protein
VTNLNRGALFVALMLTTAAQAHAEFLPVSAKPVGEIVFNLEAQGCWAANDCGMFPAHRTWIVWKSEENPQRVCITSNFLIGGPTKADAIECAWVTPTGYQVRSFKTDAPTQQRQQTPQERFDESTQSIGYSLRRIARSLWAIITLSPRSDEEIARDNAADKYSAPSSYRPVRDEKNTPGDSGAGVRSTNHLPVTHEVVTQGQPRRDARRYAVFVWASSAIYADQCMLKNDPMRTRSLEKSVKYSSSFSDEERSQASKEALAEFNRLGSYEFCRINYRAMGRPAL